MALEGTIKVPAVGPVKKTWALAGVSILAIILGVAYWRHLKSGGTAAATPAAATAGIGLGGSGTDPFPSDGTVGNPSDPYSIDPATGITYGDEQSGFGGGSLGGSGGGQAVTTGLGGGPPFLSNAAWDQAAQSFLEGIGSNPGTVAAALGKYLHGDRVTQAEQNIIESAIGAEGDPPIPGAGGFPPNIRAQAAQGDVLVPGVIGVTYAEATRILHSEGLGIAKAPGYHDPVKSQHPEAGTQVRHGTTVHVTGTPQNQATVEVPNVVGLTYLRAAAQVRAAGLKPKQNGPGTIVQERPAAGQHVKRGSQVVLFGRNK